jgi:diguanylate cyclase (GGDEF)-like protein
MNQLEGPTEQPRKVREHYEQSKDSLIMMIDDEPIVMGVVQAFLEESGYSNFILCEDSNKAMEIIRHESPDVILLDLIMPGKTGYDILFELSTDNVARYIPVIVLTVSSDSESKLRALEMGAADFLSKPVDSSELVLRLRNMLTVKAYQDRLSTHDHLTGLPNRKLFQERVQWAYRQHQLHDHPITIMHFAVDRLRLINNTMSSKIGDEVLTQIATRLNDLVTDQRLEDAMVARLGGDEFAIVFRAAPKQNLDALAKTFLSELRLPFFVAGREIVVTLGIGIASTIDVSTPDELIQKASLAVKHAKTLGVGQIELYSAKLDAEAQELMRLEQALRHALENNELELFYQPKVTALEHKIYGLEALIRWKTLDGSMVSPSHFIPVAENSGLIVSIGRWILKQACLQTKQLEALGIITRVSVNVSAHQLIEPDIVNSIREALETSQLDPSRLIIEITESVMMGDVDRSLAILHDIRALGCSLSIDDFGTGYSSLSYLKRFPIEELKIDRSFLEGIPENAEDAAIVRAIIALANSMELSVTAEGVETEQQATYLAEQGCNLLQGYHFGRPIPFAELPSFWNERNPKALS